MATTIARSENTGKVLIDKIVDELWPHVRGGVKEVLKQRTTNNRLGAMADLLRKAVVKTSIGMWNGRVYVFTGKIYEPIRWDDFNNAVYEIMKQCDLDYSDILRFMQVSLAVQGSIKSKELVVNTSLAVFNNGVLNIDTDEFLPHSKDYIQTSMANFDYDPSSRCDLWDSFLDQVLPARSVQAVLQEYLGAIFVSRSKAKLEHMLILCGSGSNGKGVIFETITGILGRDNVTNFGLDALLSSQDTKKNIALMNGKRLNYCSEIQALTSGKFTDKLKALISGEPVEARELYGENFMAHDIPLMIANCNRLPQLDDVSYGMQRRLIIINFKRIIPVELQDKQLSIKLANEYSGIFNWLLEGRERFIMRGYSFSKSREIEENVAEFTAQANNVMKFMQDKVYLPTFTSVKDVVPARIKGTELYMEYANWCVKNKEKSKTSVGFNKALAEMGYEKGRANDGIYYKVYGPAVAEMLKQQEEEYERFYSSRAGRSHKPYFKDGRMYGKGDFNAAFYAHVSRPWLSTMRIKGKLDGTFFYNNGPTPIFDIDKLIKRVESLGAYVDEDRKTNAQKERYVEEMDATSFNETMKAIKQPFRKWVHGLDTHFSEYYILVPNEWEYSEEAAQAALEEHAKQELSKML